MIRAVDIVDEGLKVVCAIPLLPGLTAASVLWTMGLGRATADALPRLAWVDGAPQTAPVLALHPSIAVESMTFCRVRPCQTSSAAISVQRPSA
jgi:hypothetical protein